MKKKHNPTVYMVGILFKSTNRSVSHLCTFANAEKMRQKSIYPEVGGKGGRKKSANMQPTVNTILFLRSESIAIMFTIIQIN
jgi:hypothetical protein